MLFGLTISWDLRNDLPSSLWKSGQFDTITVANKSALVVWLHLAKSDLVT